MWARHMDLRIGYWTATMLVARVPVVGTCVIRYGVPDLVECLN